VLGGVGGSSFASFEVSWQDEEYDSSVDNTLVDGEKGLEIRENGNVEEK
jgi:hypothetical protein